MTDALNTHDPPTKTGLIIGRGKKGQIWWIFRDRLVERSADFKGILQKFSGLTSQLVKNGRLIDFK